jgi:hypothetical protein
VATKATAADRGPEPCAPASPLALLPVVTPASALWSRCDYRSRSSPTTATAGRDGQGPRPLLSGCLAPDAIRCWAVALMIVAPDQTVMLTSWRPVRRWFRRRTISRARRGNGDAACCQPAQSQGAAGAIRPPQRMGEGIAVVEITHHRHRPCGSSAGRAKVTRMAPSRPGLAFLINCSHALALSHPDRADSPPRGQAHPDCLGTGRRAGAGGDVVSVGNLVPAKEPSPDGAG